jgi:hypothetical protein
MSMGFPANPAVGDVHVFTDDAGRKINYEWDGITLEPDARPARLRLLCAKRKIVSRVLGGVLLSLIATSAGATIILSSTQSPTGRSCAGLS